MSIMDIIGIGAFALHIEVISCIILWFGLGMPMSTALSWRRFRRDLLGIRPKKSCTPR